jgi:hypothetical protein
MTYLNLMNNVLRRLREEEVTTVNQTTYSKMVGDFINDAKTMVAQAADWSALRDTISVRTLPMDTMIGDITRNGTLGSLDYDYYEKWVTNDTVFVGAENIAHIEDTLLPWARVNMADYGPGTSDFLTAIQNAIDSVDPASSLLRTKIPDNNYSLTGSGDDVKVLSAINSTDNVYMEYQTKEWFNDKLNNVEKYSEGRPRYYTFNGLDSSGDTQVLVYPRPESGVPQLFRFRVIKRQADLVSDSDELLIPSLPVIHLAVALLARERGETGGTSAAEYFAIADKYLSDAIAIDAAKHPEEMIFRTI